MLFKDAIRVKNGDILYTHTGERVVVSGHYHNLDDKCVNDDLYIICVNSMFQTMHIRYNELCGPELCDEDKMFINWYSSTKMESTIKEAFMAGFSYGFSHKRKIQSDEELQK